MKTCLITFGALLLSLPALAQGKIAFANDSTRPFVLGYALAADVAYTGQPIPASPLPSGFSLQAVLYAGTTAGSLSLQTAVPLSGSNLIVPGRMATKFVTLTGVPGGSPAYFRVLWADMNGSLPTTMTAGGNDLYQFFNAGFLYLGWTPVFTAVPGSSINYPLLYQTDPPVNSTWPVGPVINTIPEPSASVLVGLAFVVLKQFRHGGGFVRKKRFYEN